MNEGTGLQGSLKQQKKDYDQYVNFSNKSKRIFHLEGRSPDIVKPLSDC